MKIQYLPQLSQLALSNAVEQILLGEGALLQCVNWPEVYNGGPTTTLYLARDDERMYIVWKVQNELIRTTKEHDLEQVCEDSCCELFFRVPGSVLYTNLEVNAIGFMTASRRTARKENVVRFTEEEFRQIARYSSLGCEPMMSSIKKDYVVGISLPLELMGIQSDAIPSALMLNSYKCGDKTPEPHYLSLFPIPLEKPDFHCPQFFQKVLFA